MKDVKWVVRTTHDSRQVNYIYDTKREAMKHIETYNTNDYKHILCKLIGEIDEIREEDSE